MRQAVELFLVIFLPILVFLLIVLILWLTWKPTPIPFSPTGLTGVTGMTGVTGPSGPTGMTGAILIEKAIMDDLEIVSEIDPLSVLDIVSIDCQVIALTHNQTLVFEGHSHKTPVHLRRIIGLDERLYAVDISGKLWRLESDFTDHKWEFVPVDEINSKGQIVWINTTLDQKFLWVTFNTLPQQTQGQGQDGMQMGQMQMFGGILFDSEFNIVDASSDHNYRIYGTKIDKFVSLNPRNHNLMSMSGTVIATNVAAAILDCHNDLSIIPIQDSPPLTGLRIVCSQIYTLITLFKSTSTSTTMMNKGNLGTNMVRYQTPMNQMNRIPVQNQVNQMQQGMQPMPVNQGMQMAVMQNVQYY